MVLVVHGILGMFDFVISVEQVVVRIGKVFAELNVQARLRLVEVEPARSEFISHQFWVLNHVEFRMQVT